MPSLGGSAHYCRGVRTLYIHSDHTVHIEHKTTLHLVPPLLREMAVESVPATSPQRGVGAGRFPVLGILFQFFSYAEDRDLCVLGAGSLESGAYVCLRSY